jgi:exopolyphosphatase/guanosine-5'-triphosphate,3'-diphosphate pyrophosphatase
LCYEGQISDLEGIERFCGTNRLRFFTLPGMTQKKYARFRQPTPDEQEILTQLERDLEQARDARTLVSVAGTATTMQAIALGLDRYDPDAIHRTQLSLDAAERVLEDLMRMTNAERNALVVMAPGRGDVIVAGALILISVMRRFGFESTLVSETDILDGLAFEMLDIR